VNGQLDIDFEPPQENATPAEATPTVTGLTLPVPPVIGNQTIAEGQQCITTLADAGSACPCCGQLVKLYKRNLNATRARGLIWLYRTSGEKRRWIHVGDTAPRSIVKSGGEFAKLRWWGLIQEQPNTDDEAKRTSGIWRITEAGVAFVLRQSLLPTAVYLYNNRLVGHSPDTTDIAAALGRKFSYAELMGYEPQVDEKGVKDDA
jgi:hypothetical protein